MPKSNCALALSTFPTFFQKFQNYQFSTNKRAKDQKDQTQITYCAVTSQNLAQNKNGVSDLHRSKVDQKKFHSNFSIQNCQFSTKNRAKDQKDQTKITYRAVKSQNMTPIIFLIIMILLFKVDLPIF